MKRTMHFLGSGAGDFIQEDSPHNPPGYVEEVAGYVGRNRRRAASTLLGDDILIDHHSDVSFREHRVGFDGIRHLLITHGHFDHFNPAAICKLAAGLEHPLTIYGDAMVAHAMEFAAHHEWDPKQARLVATEHPESFVMRLIRPFEGFSIGDLRVTPVPANHGIQKRYMLSEMQAFNFVFEYEDQTIFYGLDSSHILPETWTFLCNYRFDICVLDGTFGYREVDPFVSGHLNFRMLAETRDAFHHAGMLKPDARIFADHISVKYAEIESHEAAAADLRNQGVTLVYDGLKIDFPAAAPVCCPRNNAT